jgi:gliding motility-associated transport system permease protein
MDRLNGTLTIMKKEFKGYFISPIAYIVISIFLIFTGFFFFKDFFYFGQSEMRNLFNLLPIMLTLAVPAITMKLFAEEKNSGSFEILMTLPLSTIEIVVGKLLAAILFITVMISPTLIYLITVLIVGSPDMGPIIGGYLGTILLGGAFASIGIFSSALSKNQIVAFIVGWGLNFTLWLMDKVTIFLPTKISFIQYIGIDYHFQNISKGIIDTRDIIYFISIMAISILLTSKILNGRR